jgi:DNA transformation protein and related proteins
MTSPRGETPSSPRDEFVENCLDVLAVLGEVRARRMFGGYGVYRGSVMFALIADDRLYLKADDRNRAELEGMGSAPFVYGGKGGKSVTLSYYEMPPAGFECEEEALRWGGTALAAALRAREAVRPRSGRRTRSRGGR